MVGITLQGVSKTYPGGVQAVRDLSLTVAAGELLVLVGPSGCGKTTTLRLIAGLEQPTRGEILLGGRPANDLPPWQRDVALTFQRPALYPHRSVRSNLSFSLDLRQSIMSRLLGRKAPVAAERDARVLEAARLLGLEDVLDRRPGQLSGGQQQRVALGRALVRRPAVLLLDEPLANLDPPQRAELRRHLPLLRQRLPATMVYVTHDPLEALSLGDRVAVLHAGELQQADSPLAVYRRPANRFVAGFLGWPPASFLDGNVVSEDNRLWLVGDAARLPLPKAWRARLADEIGPAALCVRPDGVELGTEEGPAGEPTGTGPSPYLEMVVSLVEFQGPASLVTCTRGGWRLTASVDESTQAGADGRRRLVQGQPVMVRLRLDDAHLFDGRTGKVLVAGTG